jgi:hypothetical protein
MPTMVITSKLNQNGKLLPQKLAFQWQLQDTVLHVLAQHLSLQGVHQHVEYRIPTTIQNFDL